MFPSGPRWSGIRERPHHSPVRAFSCAQPDPSGGRSEGMDSPILTDMTVDEVAAEMKVSVQTVSRLILAGKLPAYDAGGGRLHFWRVRRLDLDAFKAGRQFQPAAVVGAGSVPTRRIRRRAAIPSVV